MIRKEKTPNRYKVCLFACGTLKYINSNVTFAINLDQARKVGEEIFRSGKNQFVTAERILTR